MTQIFTKYAGTEKANEISVNLWRLSGVQTAINLPGRMISTFEDMDGLGLAGAVATNVGYYSGKSGAWKSYEDTSVSFTTTSTGGGLVYAGTTTDNLEAAIQLQTTPYIFASSAGASLAFECMVSKDSIAATAGVGFVCGLAKGGSPANSFMADAGADIASTDFVGFASFDATGNTIDFIFKKTGGTLVTVKAGIATPVAATTIKLGFWYNGTTIVPYINGIANTNIITAAVIAGTTFPNAVKMSPVFGVKQGTNVAIAASCYGIHVNQVSA